MSGSEMNTNSVVVGVDTHADAHQVGKTDSLDAYRAAQSVLSGISTAVPKAKDGPVECLRVLRASRASAMKARSATINQIKG